MPELFRCGPCGRELPRSSFGIDRTKRHGRQSKCRDCQRALSRRHYKANRGTYLNRAASQAQAKQLARRLVSYAVANGSLRRKPCECCGAGETVAHHDDYAEPLDVRWLCRSCHLLWHAENGEGANANA